MGGVVERRRGSRCRRSARRPSVMRREAELHAQGRALVDAERPRDRGLDRRHVAHRDTRPSPAASRSRQNDSTRAVTATRLSPPGGAKSGSARQPVARVGRDLGERTAVPVAVVELDQAGRRPRPRSRTPPRSRPRSGGPARSGLEYTLRDRRRRRSARASTRRPARARARRARDRRGPAGGRRGCAAVSP